VLIRLKAFGRKIDLWSSREPREEMSPSSFQTNPKKAAAISPKLTSNFYDVVSFNKCFISTHVIFLGSSRIHIQSAKKAGMSASC